MSLVRTQEEMVFCDVFCTFVVEKSTIFPRTCPTFDGVAACIGMKEGAFRFITSFFIFRFWSKRSKLAANFGMTEPAFIVVAALSFCNKN